MIAPPELISPPDSSYSIDTNVALRWHKTGGSNGYHVQVSADEYFSNLVYNSNKITDTTVKMSGLKLDSSYYWRVRARSAGGDGEWSDGWMFTTKLAGPALVKPAQDALVPYNGVKFEWLTVKKADKYTVQVAKDNQFQNIVFEGPADNENSHMVTTLEYGITYHWRVMASNDSNSGYWSEVRKFTTSLEAASLLSPEDYSKNVVVPVEFKWDGPKIATAFHFQLAKDEAFKELVEEDTLKEKSLIVSGLEFGRYYWRVRFLADDLVGSWAEAWTFTTNFGFASLIYPEKDAEGVSIYSIMKWDAPKGAEIFRLQISKDEDFNELIVNQSNLTSKEYDLLKAKLVPAVTYYWHIRIIMGGEPGLWTETWKFTTGIDRASLLKPDDGSQNQPLEVLFKWGAISGAEFYQLNIAEDAGFTKNLRDFDNITEKQYTAQLDSGTLYHWRVRGRYTGGSGAWSKVWTFKTAGTSGIDENNDYVFGLGAYPNPFNTYAEIQYELKKPAMVSISVADISGSEVAKLLSERLPAGRKSIKWQPLGLPSGIYFIIIKTGNEKAVLRAVYQR
jgi:hypothetical protein